MMVANKPIRILLADDHPVVRIGLRNLLQAEPGFVVVGEAADGKDTLAQARRLNPEILLLDLNMPGIPGLEVLQQLGTAEASVRVIVLTGSIEEQQLVTALQFGARGIVLKDSPPHVLVQTIYAVSRGQYAIEQDKLGEVVQALRHTLAEKAARQDLYGLTPRELQVVSAIAEGCTNKDIAQRFSITEETVKTHLTNIFDKLGVSSRLELGLFAVNHHLVDS